MFLEDVLEATGFLIGRSSKWAKRAPSGKGSKEDGGGASGGGGGGAASGYGGYSEATRISLANVDESLVNTDLIEALVAHVLSSRPRSSDGGGGGAGGGKRRGEDDASAILIFAPGADEISRICRTLSSSGRVAAAGGGGGVLVLPLHGGLPPAQQSRVFNRPPRGALGGWLGGVVWPSYVLGPLTVVPHCVNASIRILFPSLAGTAKIVVSTNVAETSITIDDVSLRGGWCN